MGAAILASVLPAGADYSKTVATLHVAGLLPNRGYAVHVHTDPCGPHWRGCGAALPTSR